MELDELDLLSVLPTHRFGMWELKEDGWKVRCIDNYFSSRVNDFAWSPGKMLHGNLDDLLAAVTWLSMNMSEVLQRLAVSKTDFKSAVTTLIVRTTRTT